MDLDLSAYSVRTDLALEAHDLASASGSAIPGVHTSSKDEEGIRVSLIDITSEEGSRAIGKLPGHYITIDVPELRKKKTAICRTASRPCLPVNLKNFYSS